VFGDMTGSTVSAEQLDPEVLRGRVISRCFAELRAIIERHGGTVCWFSVRVPRGCRDRGGDLEAALDARQRTDAHRREVGGYGRGARRRPSSGTHRKAPRPDERSGDVLLSVSTPGAFGETALVRANAAKLSPPRK